MCAIGYYLERSGIMTTGISLVRENAESMQPPRSLWVSFPLGRPLGVPNDARFQHGVIGAALGLLKRHRGPVLSDYPVDAPNIERETMASCPVSFPRVDDQATWRSRLSSELSSLRPWYELSKKRRRGRTLVSVSGSTIEENHSRLGEYLDLNQLPIDELQWFKRAIEDAKAFYVEAMTAQPGDYEQTQIYEVLWRETQLGAGLSQFYEGFRTHPTMRPFARLILPRSAVGGTTG